jgi:ABC-type branched-subunit amino acid transport system ATPase component/predicted MFS family arabinose efflux permease
MTQAPGSTANDEAGAAGLAEAVLAAETERREDAARPATVLPDDLFPGTGEEMSLRDALRQGGTYTVAVLAVAQFVEQVERSAFTVLAPDIQETLGVSDAVIGAIGGAVGVLFLLGAIPISSLADRMPRRTIAAVSLAAWSVVVALVGFVQNAFQLFVARLGAGLGTSYQQPVNGPLLIDTYPIQARGRVFALYAGSTAGAFALAPVIAGGIAAVFPGDESWRWVFWIVALAAVPTALATARIREPRRGRHEMQAILGAELDEATQEVPISLGVAFARLAKIRTFHYFLLGMAALGFALFTIPLFLNLLLEDEFGLDALERGFVGSAMVLPGLVVLALVGKRSDDLYRSSPPRSLALMGSLIAGFGIFIAIAVWMPNLALTMVFLTIGSAMAQAAFATFLAPVSSVIPYRLRSRGIAMIGLYIYVFGGFLGAVITGLLSDAFGREAAITMVVLPSTIIGGALIGMGARHVRGDIALVVEELTEERDERARVASGAAVPVLQVRNLDFSYGPVQVLFDVSLDVHRGETLALLGTNGAGKSTLLKVVSGLGVAERGVVRLNGTTVTYADPEIRSRIGIVQMIGGGATFPPLTVRENLRMAGYRYPAAELSRRTERVLELFPVLRDRLGTAAADLSGGQQQMLGLAMALVHEPEILLVDELSLGLAPIVVQSVLDVVRELKQQGQTMILVEQSLNVALAVADRAVFMEKGQVRFEGPATELATRDDLARAVFLGP